MDFINSQTQLSIFQKEHHKIALFKYLKEDIDIQNKIHATKIGEIVYRNILNAISYLKRNNKNKDDLQVFREVDIKSQNRKKEEGWNWDGDYDFNERQNDQKTVQKKDKMRVSFNRGKDRVDQEQYIQKIVEPYYQKGSLDSQ